MKKRPLFFVIIFLTTILLSCPPASAQKQNEFLTPDQIIDLSATLAPQIGHKIESLPGLDWQPYHDNNTGHIIWTLGFKDIHASNNTVPVLSVTTDKDRVVVSFAFLFRRRLNESENLPPLSECVLVKKKIYGNWRYYYLLGGSMANYDSTKYDIWKKDFSDNDGRFNKDYLRDK